MAERLATTPEEAVAAAEALGYPVAAKVVSADIPHKAEAGGVELMLRSADELRRAFARIRESVARRAPGARLEGILVQPMVEGGIEVILGSKRDAQFGHTLLFGLGGGLVEAIRAFSLRVAPIDELDARAMIAEVPALGRILEKRGECRLDAASVLAPLLLRLDDLLSELGEEIEEIDLNPLILDPRTGRALAVDALVVRRGAAPGAS